MKLSRLWMAAIAFALGACGGQPSPVELTIEARNMHYEPAQLEVAVGQTVRLTFHNNDSVEHDFSIMQIPISTIGATAEPMAGHDMSTMAMDPQLHMAVNVGASNVLEFTPTQAGTYEFFCTVSGHKEAGMVGQLVVKGG